jgi:hypothetical protein
MKRLLLAVGVAGLSLLVQGCAKEGCLTGETGCHVVAPCPKVKLSCDETMAGAALRIATIETAAQRPLGRDAIGTVGDVLLQNSYTKAVVAAIGNQTNLDPGGGSIVDLTTATGTDATNQILTVTGILPNDAARYTSLEIIDERPARVAVQVKGTLDGRPDILVYTRYELTPCDRGIRARTEIINTGTDTQMWTVGDGYWWGDDEPLPFAPGEGGGWSNKPFNLLTVNDVVRSFPFLSSNSHAGDQPVSYSSVSCTDGSLEGFNSSKVSFAGLKRTVVPPRGYLTFERYFAVADGTSISAATDLAFEIRNQVLGEKYVTLTGKVERPGALKLNEERETMVLVSEGTAADGADKRTPWNTAVPDDKGAFSMRVPAGKSFVVEVHAFGQKQVEREFPSVGGDTDLGAFVLPSTGRVTFDIKDGDTAQPIDAEIFVIPADEATKTRLSGSLFGQLGTCSPWLGPPSGASPACNRILVHAGTATAEVPVGKFFLYAFHGPFWSLGRQTVELTPTTQSLSFTLHRLGLPLAGSVSADLHVHGAASFDSSIPDLDRVLSFSASDLEVIVATDHDVVYDYAALVQQLGLSSKMSTVTGVETTGHIPYLRIPNYGFPLVIGHYNFWPLRFDPLKPRNGGPFDEFIEPGELMDRATALRDPIVDEPLAELNHPWAAGQFGRDLGFPRALSLDTRRDLPTKDDGTSSGMYVRTSNGSIHTNSGHHAQEVMNGSSNNTLLQYRAFWWYVLNQGQLKAGTANSDSHSLTDNTVGMPRNVIFAGTQAGPAFEINKFNNAIREGHVLGTNGPIIDAKVESVTGEKSWSFIPFKPKDGARVKVKVYSAPWIPVAEVRFVVNGKVVKTVTANPPAADPFGTAELLRYEGDEALAELLSGVTGDAWLSVEAGSKLMLAGDLGGGLDGSPDGIPDTTDNNNDEKVDSKDVEKDSKFGPINNPTAPLETEAGFHFNKITDGYPFAFTNPFILDRDGDGKFAAPGVKGGR